MSLIVIWGSIGDGDCFGESFIYLEGFFYSWPIQLGDLPWLVC